MKGLLVTLLILFSLNLMSCGATTQFLSMQATPLTPLVVNQDFTDISESTAGNKVETVYKTNWIRFKLQVRNDHSKVITIIGFRFTAINNNTQKEKVINIGIDQIIKDNTSGFKELNSGEIAVKDSNARFIYLDALPFEEGEKGTSYRIKAEAQGWVGTSQEPEGTLTSSYFFSTTSL